MSLILKGIDLPKEGELRLIISKNGMICGAEYPKVRHAYPLNLDAEAIQISKDHGRIIDEKELKTKIHDVTLEGGILHGCIDKTAIHEVTTILAEE